MRLSLPAQLPRQPVRFLLRLYGEELHSLKRYRKHLNRVHRGGPDVEARLVDREIRVLRTVVFQLHVLRGDGRQRDVHVDVALTDLSVAYGAASAITPAAFAYRPYYFPIEQTDPQP